MSNSREASFSDVLRIRCMVSTMESASCLCHVLTILCASARVSPESDLMDSVGGVASSSFLVVDDVSLVCWLRVMMCIFC